MKINRLVRRRSSCSVSSKIRRRRSRSSKRPSLKSMKMKKSCLFHLLPVEIAADIFPRLPLHSIVQCKLVCKTWRDLLLIKKGFLLRHMTEPGFHYGEYNDDDDDDKVPCFNLSTKSIFNHQYHPFQDAKEWYVVGSCNGLICLRRHKECHHICTSSSCEHGTDHHHHDMYVCNPYTGEYAKLPNPNHPKLDDDADDGRTYGFGYHHNTREYKVIRIYHHHSRGNLPQVYTLGSDTAAWRSIRKIEHKLYRSPAYGIESGNNSWGIVLNEVLYWLTENRQLIISFDIAEEEFRKIPTTLPEFSGPCVLGVLSGCLCLSTGFTDSTRIWVMNNDDYSWVKKFSVSWRNNSSPYYPLAHPGSGKILLHCNFHKLISYDPETEHIVELKMRDRFFDIIPYMKSTVSLKALGEKEAIQVNEGGDWGLSL